MFKFVLFHLIFHVVVDIWWCSVNLIKFSQIWTKIVSTTLHRSEKYSTRFLNDFRYHPCKTSQTPYQIISLNFHRVLSLLSSEKSLKERKCLSCCIKVEKKVSWGWISTSKVIYYYYGMKVKFQLNCTNHWKYVRYCILVFYLNIILMEHHESTTHVTSKEEMVSMLLIRFDRSLSSLLNFNNQ